MIVLILSFTALFFGFFFGCIFGAFVAINRPEPEPEWKTRFTEHRPVWIDEDDNRHKKPYCRIGKLRNDSGKVSQDYEYKLYRN